MYIRGAVFGVIIGSRYLYVLEPFLLGLGKFWASQRLICPLVPCVVL